MTSFNVGDIALDRYKIEENLGKGCFGDSYKALDIQSEGPPLVLKIIDTEYCQLAGFVNSFTMLAHSSKNLKVDDYAPILNIQFSDPHLIYVRPFIEGQSLRYWLTKALEFKVRMQGGLQILRKLSGVIHQLHNFGHFAHLKPENIFLYDKGVVLTDNWIAPFIPPEEFQKKEQAARYLPYLAPEIKNNWTALSKASDYYSMGALLHEVLLGKAPSPTPLIPSEKSNLYGVEADNILANITTSDPAQRTQDVNKWQSEIQTLREIFKLGGGQGSTQKIKIQESNEKKLGETSLTPSPSASIKRPPPQPPKSPQVIEEDEEILEELEQEVSATHLERKKVEPKPIPSLEELSKEPPKLQTPTHQPPPIKEPEIIEDDFLEEEELSTSPVSHLAREPAPLEEELKKNQPVFNKTKKAPREEISDDMSRFRKKVHLPPAKASKKTIPTWIKITLAFLGLIAVGGSIVLGVIASTLWK